MSTAGDSNESQTNCPVPRDVIQKVHAGLKKPQPYPPPCFSKLSEGTELKKIKNLKAFCINDRESKWFLLLVKFDFRRREILTSIAKTVV